MIYIDLVIDWIKIFVSEEQLNLTLKVNNWTIQILAKVILQNKLQENPNFLNNF